VMLLLSSSRLRITFFLLRQQRNRNAASRTRRMPRTAVPTAMPAIAALGSPCRAEVSAAAEEEVGVGVVATETDADATGMATLWCGVGAAEGGVLVRVAAQ